MTRANSLQAAPALSTEASAGGVCSKANDQPKGVQSVAAVIVTFHPDPQRLQLLLNSIAPQVERIYVVDNGSTDFPMWTLEPLPHASIESLGSNLGIAAAQNVGARAAMASGAAFVLLLDQDSVPARDMVQRLLEAWRSLSEAGYRIGVVGPRAVGREGPSGFVRFGWFRYREIEALSSQPWVLCDLLIASGSLISAAALELIGPMDESLFIDKVDTEWCLRAAACGYVLAGVPAAVLEHQLGEWNLKVWWRRWKYLPAHHPFRYYYVMRNSVLLLRKPHANWRWRTADIKQSLLILLFFGLVSPARRENLRMMLRGLMDGMRARSGPLNDSRQRLR